MTQQLGISVVIRAFNEGEHIGRLLKGFSQQTRQPDEIILVDSGSTDNTVEIAEAAGCRIVQIDKSDFSFGRALNLGCSHAKHDILIFTSAHVYPIYDTYVENLVGAFLNSGVGIAYGRQVGNEQTKFSESRIFHKWFPNKNDWDQRHPFSNNANAAVLKELWCQLPYNENLTGLEDLDFAKRALGLGQKISYVADAPVIHVHQENWDGTRNRYRREAIAYSHIIDGSKMSLLQAIRLAVSNVANDYFHALKAHKLRANLLSIPLFRSAQFVGAWQGFNSADKISDQLLNRFYYPSRPQNQSSTNKLGREVQYSGEQ